MKFKLKSCVILLMFISFLSFTAKAQESTSKTRKDNADCNSYKFAKTEDFTRFRAKGGEADGVAELTIKRFLEQCPDSQFRPLAEEQLKTVQEARKDHNILVAKYYLKEFENQGKGLKGAMSRLKEFSEKYPEDSRTDEVLYLLIKTYIYDKNFDEAKQTYRRLLSDFYLSPYICQANELLRQTNQ